MLLGDNENAIFSKFNFAKFNMRIGTLNIHWV